eukprot:gnl/TRDRNA2_/TRDRNA2_181853_c0_seq1.p1 gnl/TRDRNA2_/TRDRNA2_181853_c0~~gnl/TRDRNA2_/TRDRNA2_181853_c0_seq1.p1  ORF type:complete len:337 (-),score=45.25 gnl/TRDRNA2_/TRDRNA2_181853_c0_seq1:53-955(-)
MAAAHLRRSGKAVALQMQHQGLTSACGTGAVHTTTVKPRRCNRFPAAHRRHAVNQAPGSSGNGGGTARKRRHSLPPALSAESKCFDTALFGPTSPVPIRVDAPAAAAESSSFARRAPASPPRVPRRRSQSLRPSAFDDFVDGRRKSLPVQRTCPVEYSALRPPRASMQHSATMGEETRSLSTQEIEEERETWRMIAQQLAREVNDLELAQARERTSEKEVPAASCQSSSSSDSEGEPCVQIPLAKTWDYPLTRSEKQLRLAQLLEHERISAEQENQSLRRLVRRHSRGCSGPGAGRRAGA